jgi:cyclic beta-1,2-glucan synthetase
MPDGLTGAGRSAFSVCSSLLCTSHLAVALVNWLATLLARRTRCRAWTSPRGSRRNSRTLVVVPTMLTSAQNIEDLIEALEVRFLANRDDHLHFGLLTDFRRRPGNAAGGRAAVAAGP